MKPQQLKCPFTWKDRSVMIHDRVWYIPKQYDQYDSFTFPGWNHPNLFSQEQPVRIEYCSGNGAWIAAKAADQKQINWVAVELNFDRVKKIWSKLKNDDLDNLLIISGEGFISTQNYFPSNSIEAVYVNFPDPWPKTRHAKHRLLRLPFIIEINRILKKEGVLSIVTDDPHYSKEIIQTIDKCKEFHSVYQDPFYTTQLPDYGSSYFEDLWRSKGKEIRYHQFIKS